MAVIIPFRRCEADALAVQPAPLSQVFTAPREDAPVNTPALAPTRRGPRDKALGRGPRDPRDLMLGKIHIAKKQLMNTLPCFDDVVYRDILHNLFGASSAKELHQKDMHRLLLHFAALGFTAKKSRHREHAPATLFVDPTPLDRAPRMAKIEAMLAEKARHEGTDVPWPYAVAILKRQSGGVTRVFEHATPEQLDAVIAALWRDAKRKGRKAKACGTS